MFNLLLHKNRLENEWQTTLHITKNNHFHAAVIHNLRHSKAQKRTQSPSPTLPAHLRKNEKMGHFYLHIPKHQEGHKPIQTSRCKNSFQMQNTLTCLVKITNSTRTPPHNKPGIYQLKCNTCNLSYIGQTSRHLKTRYHKHIRYIKNNNPQSAYAQHILKNRHEFRKREHNDPPKTSPQPTFPSSKWTF